MGFFDKIQDSINSATETTKLKTQGASMKSERKQKLESIGEQLYGAYVNGMLTQTELEPALSEVADLDARIAAAEEQERSMRQQQVPQPQVKDQPQQGYNDQHVHADLQPQGRAGGRGDRSGSGDQAVSEHTDGHCLHVVGKHETPAGDHGVCTCGSEKADCRTWARTETDEGVRPARPHDGDGIARDGGRHRHVGDGRLGGSQARRRAHGRERGKQ